MVFTVKGTVVLGPDTCDKEESGSEAIEYESGTRHVEFFELSAERLEYSKCQRENDDGQRSELVQRTCSVQICVHEIGLFCVGQA